MKMSKIVKNFKLEKKSLKEKKVQSCWSKLKKILTLSKTFFFPGGVKKSFKENEEKWLTIPKENPAKMLSVEIKFSIIKKHKKKL